MKPCPKHFDSDCKICKRAVREVAFEPAPYGTFQWAMNRQIASRYVECWANEVPDEPFTPEQTAR